jgi:hypothetical protein
MKQFKASQASFWTCALSAIAGLVFAVSASGQATTGQIGGRVTDSTGAVITDAAITITDENKGVTFSGHTDASGNYTVLSMPPGLYSVTARASGFNQTKVAHVALSIDQHAELNFLLKIGDVSSEITVTDTAPLLQTQTAEVGTVIGGSAIVDLPLAGRNFYALTMLVPGVTTGSSGINALNISVGGQRAYSNSVQMDGIESTTNRTQDVTVTPNVDAVDQFKVVTAAYNAEFGNAAGGVIAIQTKAGGNAFHGDAYEFFRPNFLTAKQTIPGVDTPQPASTLKQHNFGATFGGPIKKDRSFFFVAYEGMRQKSAFSDVTSTIPFGLFDLSTGNADFSKLVDPYAGKTGLAKDGKPYPGAGTVVKIFDPNTDNAWWPTQFPNNTIPKTRISQAGLNTLLNFYPKPNLQGIDNGWFRNYQAWAPTSNDTNQVDARFDQVITSKDRLYSVYHWLGNNILDGDQYYGHTAVPGAGDADQAQKEDDGSQSISLTYDHIFSANALNEFRFGYLYYHQHQYSLLNGTDYSTKFGFGNVAVPGYAATIGMPTIYMADGYLAGGSSYKPYQVQDNNYQFGDSYTWSGVPKHEFKFGADLRLLNSRPNFSYFPTGWQYYGSFGNSVTSAQAYWGYYYDAAGNWLAPHNSYNWLGGSDIADLLLGLPLDTYMGLQLTNPHTKSNTLDFYAQDSYKVTPKLTLNYGIRYEFMGPWTEANNNMANFDLASGNLLIAGRNGVSNGILQVRKNDFSPRFGFAYNIDPKTVIRAGSAIFYSPENDGREDYLTKNPPFAEQNTYSNWFTDYNNYQADKGVVRNTAINIPTAGFIQPKSLANGTTATTYSINPNMKTGTTGSFNLAVERQLSRTMSMDVAYVGSISKHLSYGIGDINADPTISQGSKDYDGRLSQYLGKIQYLTDAGLGKYNSLQVKLTRQMSRNSSFLLSYTYGHSLDNGPAPFDMNSGNQPQNPYNLKDEYATSDADVRHNVVFSGDYNLPFGKGQAFGSNWGQLADAIVGGWKFGGILTMHTGTPVNVVLGNDPKSALAGVRPDVSGNPNLPHDKRDVLAYFDTDAFSAPVVPKGSSYAYGNAGRNLITGPGFINVDASLAKEFALENSWKLQLRAEAFNGMNSVHYTNPDGNMGSPTFGQINSTMGDQRRAQLAAKFIF